MGCVGGQRCSTRAERAVSPMQLSTYAAWVLARYLLGCSASRRHHRKHTEQSSGGLAHFQCLDERHTREVGMDPTWTAAALKYGSDRGGSGILVRAGQR